LAESAGRETYRVWQPPGLGERVRIITPSAADGGLRALEAVSAPVGFPRDHSDRESRLSATERGDRIHRLLEMAARLGVMPPGQGRIHREAAAVFANPGLAWVFRPEKGRGFCEVPIIHRRRPAGDDRIEERITGSIDRLVLRPGRADIIDYKSNRLGEDPAYRKTLIEHYRPQLDAYREAVTALFPDREVHAWLLFTDPMAGNSPLSEVFSDGA
jgi:ATP-dependent exoDNAse (exonuclease V) beta subunit